MAVIKASGNTTYQDMLAFAVERTRQNLSQLTSFPELAKNGTTWLQFLRQLWAMAG